jgi:AcrR family transcriptional regulator
MGESGFHAMSIQALAEAAEVSVGLIYQYFGSKEDVLQAVIVDILEAYRDEVPTAIEHAGADPVEQLVAGFVAYCEVVDSHRRATVLAYRESGTLNEAGLAQIKDLELATIEPLYEVIRLGQQAGVFIDIDPDLTAHDLMLFAHGWALKHWHLAPRLTLSQYVDHQLAIILKSMLSPDVWPSYEHHLGPTPERPSAG